jgi:hypothetical protein
VPFKHVSNKYLPVSVMFVCSLLVIMILLTIERLILKHIRIEQVIHLSTAFLTWHVI